MRPTTPRGSAGSNPPRHHPDFPIQNLPLGIFSPSGHNARPGVAIGDMILDLSGVGGLLPDAVGRTLAGGTLNALLALPAAERVAMRRKLSALLSDETQRALIEPLLYPAADCVLHLPAAIGDYTDFYGRHSSRRQCRRAVPTR